MGRKKRLADDAAPVTIYLTTEERLVLQVIEGRRQRRTEGRDSPSEIVADALWRFLEEVEKMPRQQIEALLPEKPKSKEQSKIKRFPKPKND